MNMPSTMNGQAPHLDATVKWLLTSLLYLKGTARQPLSKKTAITWKAMMQSPLIIGKIKAISVWRGRLCPCTLRKNMMKIFIKYVGVPNPLWSCLTMKIVPSSTSPSPHPPSNPTQHWLKMEPYCLILCMGFSMPPLPTASIPTPSMISKYLNMSSVSSPKTLESIPVIPNSFFWIIRGDVRP